MIYTADLKSALQSIPWFLELSSTQLERLASISDLCQVKAGFELFREGEQDDRLYVVLEGQVAIEMIVPTQRKVRIFTAEPLDIIGWSGMTPVVRQRTASARTLLPTRLISFGAEDLRRLCDEDPSLGYIIMRRLANVVASRLLTTRLQLMDMVAHPAHENQSLKTILE